MGAGTSVPSYATDADDGYKAERARELDRLGGSRRQAVRHGDSMKYKLEWLQGALLQTGQQLEAALAKNPLAGRHEIMAQEMKKAVREANMPANTSGGVKLSVKDWQRANHNDLRARIIASQKLKQQGGALKPTKHGAQWQATPDPAAEAGRQARARIREYYLGLQAAQRSQEVEKRAKQLVHTYERHGLQKAPGAATVSEGAGHKQSPGAAGTWRDHVLAAKKTAWRTVAPALAFKSVTSGSKQRKGPVRLDSFSFLIGNHLGSDLRKYEEEAGKLMTALQASKPPALESQRSLASRSSIIDAPEPSLTPPAPHATGRPLSPTKAQRSTTRPVPDLAFKPGAGGRPGSVQMASRPRGGLLANVPPVPRPKTSATLPSSQPLSLPGAAAKTVTLPGEPEPVASARSTVSGGAYLAQSTSRKARHSSMGQALDLENEAEAAAHKPRSLMALHVHRCNSRWAEGQAWDVPPVTHLQRLAAEANGGQVAVFRAAAVQALRDGAVAVQVFVGEEVVQLSVAHMPYNLWATDPWAVLRILQPNKANGVDSLSGVAMGPRLMLGLAAAVELAAGAEAVKKLHVIIHCSEAQEAQIASDLAARSHFGLDPANVLLISQQARPGYVWDVEQRCFVSKRDHTRSMRRRSSMGSRLAASGRLRITMKVPSVKRTTSGARRSDAGLSKQDSRPRTLKDATALPTLGGSGYCMMQLGWEGEAQLVSAAGDCSPLPGTALEYLSSRGVSWLLTRQLRDLSMYNPSLALQTDALAAMLYLHEAQGATAAVWVDMGASLQAAAAGLQGVVLGQTAHVNGATTSRSGAGTMPASQPKGERSAPATTLPHGPAPLRVVDLEAPALVSPKLASILLAIRDRSRGAGLPASSKRYLWHLPTLTEALAEPGVLRPVLTIKGACTFVSFDAAQLTQSPAVHCAALCAGPSAVAKMLNSGQDSDDLLAVMKAQDSSGIFRRMLANTAKQIPAQSTEPNLGLSPQHDLGDAAALKQRTWAGKRVVLLVKDTQATATALRLALATLRPGRDLLLLMAVATGGLSGEQATRAALAKYLNMARGAAVDCAAEMLPKDSQPLLDMIEEYVEEAEADLVVVGSRGQTSGGCKAMGSVAYGLMKVLPCPILVVNAAARNADVTWERDALRVMVPVGHTSRGLLRWVGSRLLQATRQDKVFLAWSPPEKTDPVARLAGRAEPQEVQGKRMLDNFHDILFSFHIHGTKKMLEGSYTTAGIKWADAEKCHIMALHAPPGRTLPESVLTLLNASRSAVLLYKGNANDPV